jgi:hypothetical protein
MEVYMGLGGMMGLGGKQSPTTGDTNATPVEQLNTPDYGTQAPYPAPDGSTALPPPQAAGWTGGASVVGNTQSTVASNSNIDWNALGQNPRGYITGQVLKSTLGPAVTKAIQNPIGSIGSALFSGPTNADSVAPLLSSPVTSTDTGALGGDDAGSAIEGLF